MTSPFGSPLSLMETITITMKNLCLNRTKALRSNILFFKVQRRVLTWILRGRDLQRLEACISCF